MSWELPDPPRDEDMVYVDDDVADFERWIARGLARLGDYLEKWADFVRRYGA